MCDVSETIPKDLAFYARLNISETSLSNEENARESEA